MKQLTINPNNKRFYSEDFIKGFECGTQRQLEADKADRPQGEWIKDGHHIRCNQCGVCFCNRDREGDEFPQNFCPSCGAKMKGADDEV